MTDMTPQALVELCKKNGGYRQPHLNDQLYLQLQGFRAIKNLEPYKNVRAIWMDQNAISEITGLGHMSELATLFVQHNFIRRLNRNSLQGLGNLRILDLSNNHLTRVTGLESVPLLETLQMTHNRIQTLSALRGIMVCQKLSCVDVSFNLIEAVGSPETDHASDEEGENINDQKKDDEDEDDDDDGGGEKASSKAANEEKDQQHIMTNNSDAMVAFWAQLPELGVLYMHGNELPRKCKFYRKRMIVGLPQLTYLDERPVFPDERRTTEAWGRGGADAEEQERVNIRTEKNAEMERNFKAMTELKGARKEQREKADRELRARIEEEAAWRAEMRVVWTKERTEVDHEEYEQRALLIDDEELAFRREIERLATESESAARLSEERRRIEQALLADVAAETGEIEREMMKERSSIRSRHEEMKRLIDTFKNEPSIFPKHQLDEEDDALAAAALPENFDPALDAALKKDAEGLLNMLSAAADAVDKRAARLNEEELEKDEEKEAKTSSAAAAAAAAATKNKNSSSERPLPPGFPLPHPSNQQQEAPKRVAQTKHWDAFLSMESRNNKKRRW